MSVLTQIQSELKAPKNQYNSFGKYNYRSCEDILEGLKPLLASHKAELVLYDEVVEVGGRVYIKATAKFKAGDEQAVGAGYAREPEQKKGMDEAQITGTASSYARKYALNGLFLIDDSKDADTDEYKNAQNNAPQAKAKSKFSDEQKAEMERWADGTFNPDELAKIMASLNGPKWTEAFDRTKAEYAKRKKGTPSEAENAGASAAFDGDIF